MNENIEQFIRAAKEHAEIWFRYALQEENYPVLAGIALFVAVLILIIRKRAKSRSLPGFNLRENMEKMRKEAPYKGNRK